jgi:hypothetical protein
MRAVVVALVVTASGTVLAQNSWDYIDKQAPLPPGLPNYAITDSCVRLFRGDKSRIREIMECVDGEINARKYIVWAWPHLIESDIAKCEILIRRDAYFSMFADCISKNTHHRELRQFN